MRIFVVVKIIVQQELSMFRFCAYRPRNFLGCYFWRANLKINQLPRYCFVLIIKKNHVTISQETEIAINCFNCTNNRVSQEQFL